MMLVCVGFSACSDDDDDSETNYNYAQQVAGTYVGTGKLTYYGIEADSWSGMKVIVTSSSYEYVLVRLTTADNTTILDGRAFQVSKTSSGYSLRSDENTSIVLSIDNYGNLTYTNPSVSVDGSSGYTISFTGQKED